MYLGMYVCMYVCMHVMYVCVYVCMYVCLHVMYVCVYVCIYEYVCMHTRTHTVKPRYSATVCSPHFVTVYRRLRYIQYSVNREFMLTDFHGRQLTVALYQELIVCVCVCVRTYVCMCVCVCMYVCMYVCVCVCMCVYVCR